MLLVTGARWRVANPAVLFFHSTGMCMLLYVHDSVDLFSRAPRGALQEAHKRMRIKRLPNVLALHLKRFKYMEQLQRFKKLSYRIAFPMEVALR